MLHFRGVATKQRYNYYWRHTVIMVHGNYCLGNYIWLTIILLEIHPFFSWTKWLWEEGCKHQSNNNIELKQKLENKQSNTTVRKNRLRWWLICSSFQGWYFYMPWFVLFRVEFPSVSDSYVMFVLPFKLKFHESQWSFIPKDLTSQMILPEN